MTRRLLATFVGGLLLLGGVTYRQARERADWRPIGVSAIGDTLWLDHNGGGNYWGARIQGPATPRSRILSIRVDCPSHAAPGVPSDIAPAFADSACAVMAAAR